MASMFLKEGEIYYKMVYCTLCLGSVNCQKSRCKVRKTDFSDRGLSLKGEGMLNSIEDV